MRTLKEILKEINDWQDKVFTHSTPDSIAKHLFREAKELLDEPTDSEEMADIFLLLAGTAHLSGVDLEVAVEKKMAINRARTWGQPDVEGVVEHVKETEPAVHYMKLDSTGKPYGIGTTDGEK